ncbi:sugar fermentation stimulation protein A [Marinobacterium halophilum]|uniref:Sugar fermentation stimulation protein homolog n=1 Tax=Marinobacterium halophilum TaxID=267374 RepID=A0A2P8EQG9_9GAMM|nr:DNA/RNA nuclease SfsA [Marinobacterium halophilum]PSL11716.1 sugar fermentation stimulation protein A [Marinobacterium halophilum]
MNFDPPLETVTLLRRYKRFLADVRRADGSEMTVHCPNTGSMKNCVLDGEQPALVSDSANPKRKYRYTLEALQVAHGHWAGVNTSRTNALVEEAVRGGWIPELSPASGVEREVTYGDSRFDLALGPRNDPHTYIEVKNVTLGPGPEDVDDGVIAFPDSVTVRGQKHLTTLMQVVASGKRAVLFFCVQHTGATAARPADEIDARYGQLLREAIASGVQVLAWKVDVSPHRFELQSEVPVLLSS